jgi:copper oxidase (laccase) domain-containing protein
MRTPPEQLIAWLGPAAGPQKYEVGVEVYDTFVAKDWRAGAAFTSTRPDHWNVDLYALARRRLEGAGMAATDIHGGDLCTISDPQRFYSHRRDQRTGRMASLIWIEAWR